MYFCKCSASILLASLLLNGCGGLGLPCAGISEYFSISFDPSTQYLQRNVNATIVSTVTPSKCKSDMSFSVRTGTIPPGMYLSNGNISGTPTKAGTYGVSIQIDKVDNYGSFSMKPSDSVTLVVN